MKKYRLIQVALATLIFLLPCCIIYSCWHDSGDDEDDEGRLWHYPPSISYPHDYSFPPGFYAIYTKIDSGEPWEEHARTRTGNHADIVVHFDTDRQIVFWRTSSYLPYWKTESGLWYFDEIVPRTGDGTEVMPDKINRYSYVRIIENGQNKVVVHWRYFPDFSNVEWDGVVDEYFTITPEGKVTRTIREGTEKIDDWNDPQNMATQELELLTDGIHELSFTPANPQNLPGDPVAGNPLRGPVVGTPIAYWQFDEGLGQNHDVTREDVGGYNCTIGGHKSLWKAGVSGTALQFDGYYSKVTLPASQAPAISTGLTVEAWIALGAYPQMDWAPILHQSDWGSNGYYLGVNPEGHLGFHVSVRGSWQSVVHLTPLDRFRWYHAAATFNATNGIIRLFIDGQQKESKEVIAASMNVADTDIVIGQNNRKMPAVNGRLRDGTWPSLFGIDGLIDEVGIYDTVLSQAEISQSYSNFSPDTTIRDNPDMQNRVFPANPNNTPAAAFGAEYAKLIYHEAWDNMWRVSDHPDVVVYFDQSPVRMAFWRGLSFGPALITENGKWVGDQSSENYKEIDDPGEAQGCCEHMSDKQCRHSHVRIIENTDARVVIHWRYGLVDSRYYFPDVNPQTGWGDWVDEYWTIYPDAVAVRYLERGKIWDDGWTETILYSQPETFPEDNVELEAYTLVTASCQVKTYSWENGYPADLSCKSNPAIGMVNTKSTFKPFNILPSGSKVSVFCEGPEYDNTNFHWRNHYPVSQITSDGWSARTNDRASHSSLVWPIPGSNDYLIYGLTDQSADSLIPLYRSWNSPPPVTITAGCSSQGYDKAQCAYILSLIAENATMSFTVNASSSSPVVNPCFVVKNWASDASASLTINGQDQTPGPDFRQGIVRDTDGTRNLVVWIRSQAASTVDINISR